MLVDFIIPHHNDSRVLRAIDSILSHKSSSLFRIILQDTGANATLSFNIASKLRTTDLHIIQPDNGIFDALNKGLESVESDWVGWIGSDDLIANEFDPSYLINCNNNISAVSYETIFFSDRTKNIKRIYKPLDMPLLRRWGAHVPHFSTYVRSNVAKNIKFDLCWNNFGDQKFFYLIEKNNKLVVVNNLSTLMSDGGTSNSSILSMLKMNVNVFRCFSDLTNVFHASIFIFIKFIYKISQKINLKSKKYLCNEIFR